MIHSTTSTVGASVTRDAIPARPATHSRSMLGAVCAASLAAIGGLTTSASAQLTPDRLYYGVDRPMPMSVARPAGNAAGADESELSIAIYSAGAAEPLATASVSAGKVDLSSLFPVLWTEAGAADVHYAQFRVGDADHGAPVVLQPMVSPQNAFVDRSNGQVTFAPGGGVYSGIRAYTERTVVFETDRGSMEFRMRPDQAPNTVWNFLTLVDGGFYTDVIFHRIVPTLPSGEPFVIQVGDPTGTGAGGPGYMIDLEPSKLPHDFGVLSMARSQDPDSNGSQVFVCLSRAGTSFLDGRYCSFAEAISGTETITTIAKAPLGGEAGQTPLDPQPVITRAFTKPAPAMSARTAVVVDPALPVEDD